MKKIVTVVVAVMITTFTFAQAPEKMSYQAVIRDASNALVSNQSIGMRVSILQGSATGTEVYQEIYNPNPQTNINGLVSVEIGSGIQLIGTFTSIDWASGPYFIKTETDPAGGTNYTISGTSQLLSVPYALYAENGLPKGNMGQTLVNNNGDWMADSTLLVDSNTNYVGINRTIPIGAEKFQVHQDVAPNNYGGMYINTNETSGVPFYGLSTNGAAKAWMAYDGGNDQLFIHHAAAGSDAIIINSQGSVGFGGVDPDATLHVDGTAKLKVPGVGVGKVLTSTDTEGTVEWKTMDESIPDMIRYVDIPIESLSESPSFSTITRDSYGYSFTNDFSEGAKGIFTIPSDWNQVTPIELEVYFAKTTNSIGTSGFAIRYSGGGVGSNLVSDPGSTSIPVINLEGNAFTLYKQIFSLTNITPVHEFIRLYALQRSTTGTTYTGNLIVTHLRLKYNAKR